MKTSVHTSIIQLLSKLFLVTYIREKDQLFGKKGQNLSSKSRGNVRLFLFFNAVLRHYGFQVKDSARSTLYLVSNLVFRLVNSKPKE